MPSQMTREELLRRWVEALRSGAYEQGRKQLRAGDKFCCLGVLCDLSGKGAWNQAGRYTAEGEASLMYAPLSVTSDAGMDFDAALPYADMNDQGASFTAIADRIEADHPEVFGAPANA